MKLLDLKFGKELSGRFLLLWDAAQSEWEDKIVELQRIDEGILGFEAPNTSDSDSIIEVEPNSADAKVLMWELQSGQVSILGCIMKATDQEVEIKGQAFTLTEAEIPIQLQVALTDEFIETVVMRQWSKVKTFKDAKRCLEREFLLDKFGYWFVTSGTNQPDLQREFTVIGASLTLDLAFTDDKQQLLAKRIVKHRGQNLDRRPIYLMRQPLEFCDKTAASTTHSAAILALAKAVRENNSWIASWKRYNSEEGRILEERFGCLPPLPYQGRPKLKSDDSSKSVLIFNLEPSANLQPWVEHISSDGLPVIIESDGGKPEGLAVDCDQRNKRLTVVWESDKEPPSNGIISPSMALEEWKLKKRDNALKTLETARAGLPYLGLIFEGKTFERAIPRRKKIITKPARKMFGGTGPTPAQEKALRIALSTPDIAVIQGPPGTGKTRVIQALLTMLNEGRNTNDGLETVLVTSLQHEAVDNAIAGMSLSGLPVDRLGGKKGEDRGAEEIQAWGYQVIEVVRAHLKNEPSATRTLIDQLKGSLSHWRTSAGGREGTREIILAFRNAAEEFLSPHRIAELDRLVATVPAVQTQPKPAIEDADDREELEHRLNQQCTAIEHLASRPELWQSRTATRITPAQIRSEVPEETLDLYENRVVVTLVRRLLRWLSQRLREVDSAYYQTQTLHENLFTEYQYNRFREERLRALWQNLDTVDYLQQYERSQVLKDKISYLYTDISSCFDSVLYKSLSAKPDAISPLKPTNILQMDADYRRLRQLWEMLDRFFSNSDQPSAEKERDLLSDYANYIHGCVLLALRWIGFESAQAKPENFPLELDFQKALQQSGWTAVVESPAIGNFNINIELIWEQVNSDTRKSSHPTRIRLVLIPLVRGLFGDQDEIKKTLDTLYPAALTIASSIDNTSKRRNRNNKQVQTFVVLVHPTDPRDRQISEDVAPGLIQRMINIGENFMSPDDYKNFVFTSDDNASVRRVGMMPASPLDLNTLERFQRLFRFHILGVDLINGVHPSFCPVCNYDLSSVQLQFKENEGNCSRCEAKWGWRTCKNCGGKVAKLEPMKIKSLTKTESECSHAVKAMAQEQLLGRDLLSALCGSEQTPESGRIRVICPARNAGDSQDFQEGTMLRVSVLTTLKYMSKNQTLNTISNP